VPIPSCAWAPAARLRNARERSFAGGRARARGVALTPLDASLILTAVGWLDIADHGSEWVLVGPRAFKACVGRLWRPGWVRFPHVPATFGAV